MGEIRVLFETVNPVPNAAPTYNGAPTDTLPVVRLDRDGRRSLDPPPLGDGSLVGQGHQDRRALHQRDGRDGGEQNRLSGTHSRAANAASCRSMGFTNGRRPGPANSPS